MQNVSLKKNTQKFGAQKARVSRNDLRGESSEGIPEFMLRLAREQRVRIFEGLAMPKYRHD